MTRTIEEAVVVAKSIGDQSNGMQTLVTGSLHLVCGAMRLIEVDQASTEAMRKRI